jgi:hypothetical protein
MNQPVGQQLRIPLIIVVPHSYKQAGLLRDQPSWVGNPRATAITRGPRAGHLA